MSFPNVSVGYRISFYVFGNKRLFELFTWDILYCAVQWVKMCTDYQVLMEWGAHLAGFKMGKCARLFVRYWLLRTIFPGCTWRNKIALYSQGYVGRVGKIERQDACRDASRDAVGVEGGWNVMSWVPTEVVKAVDWLWALQHKADGRPHPREVPAAVLGKWKKGPENGPLNIWYTSQLKAPGYFCG